MNLIVVGIDGSADSLVALRWAADEARRHGARLRVVAAWHTSAITSLPAWGVAEPARKARDELQAGLDATLADEGVGGADGPEVEAVVIEGHPATAILEASDGADLVVVGTRGHGGLGSLVLGSVSQHVVHHAPCPVVVVPSST